MRGENGKRFGSAITAKMKERGEEKKVSETLILEGFESHSNRKKKEKKSLICMAYHLSICFPILHLEPKKKNVEC